MIRFFRVLGRVLSWLLRTRALRPVFALLLCLWAFDGLVTTTTDSAWFTSIGMSELWRQQFAWSAGVGALFVVLAVGASVPLMRAVARPVAGDVEAPPLPRALARWQPLRSRASRLGWGCIIAVALFLGHGLSLRWSEFALAWSAVSVSGSDGATVWMTRLPALQSGLAALWAFALVLGAIGLGAGLLRALPFLAARPSVVPSRWLSALWGMGIVLCALRATGFLLEAVRHSQPFDGAGGGRVGFVALNVLGALGCAALAVLLRHPRPKLALVVAAVLIMPGLGGDVLRLIVGPSSLAPALPPPLVVSSLNPDDWPQWDEATLMRAMRLYLPRDGQHHVEWQRAGISERRGGRGSRADIVGTPVVGDEWAGHGFTDREGQLAWQSLELPEQRGTREEPPIGPLFYGLNARPLLSEEEREVGVPFRGWFWKLAWAWRLRDPLLPVEGARAQRLLVVRGAREVGQKLAPFWTWDDVMPRRDPRTGAAYFECVAYDSSARLAQHAAFENGILAGQQGVMPVAVLRLDARSGEVHLAPFGEPEALATRELWKRALPALFASNAPESAATPALEVAYAGGSSLAWIRTAQGWQKKAVPLDLREALRRKMDEFAGTARSNSSNHLDGATPMLWRQQGELFLAQAFFDLSPTPKISGEPNGGGLPLVAGVAAGALKADGARWSATFVGAHAALLATSENTNSSPASASPFVTSNRPARDLAREALEAEHAATLALQKGLYVEARNQRARVLALLKELARTAR